MFCLNVFSFAVFKRASHLPFANENPEAITANALVLLQCVALPDLLNASIIVFNLYFPYH